MANQNAVAPAQSAVASATAELFNSAEVETIEQLGRDYWVAEDAKAKAERKIGSCDVALFDIVKGMNYPAFIQVRAHFVTGCRDKGAPTDEAASKTWERAINRIITSCNFERPRSGDKDAVRMSEKAEKLKAELGERAHVVVAKMDEAADIDRLAKEAEAAMGKIDILVNNAGITRDNISMRMKDEEIGRAHV